jgi:hypothetical protein
MVDARASFAFLAGLAEAAAARFRFDVSWRVSPKLLFSPRTHLASCKHQQQLSHNLMLC